jgi:hypothetical protein
MMEGSKPKNKFREREIQKLAGKMKKEMKLKRIYVYSSM